MRRKRTSDIPNVGRRIKAARGALGLTQEQVGAGSGVAHRSIGAWERGEKVPNATQLGRVVAWFRNIHGLDLYTYDPASRQDPGVVEKIMALPGFTEAQKLRMIRSLEAVEEN